MALSFRTVFVEFTGFGPPDLTHTSGFARWEEGVTIRTAEAAIKSFHIGYVETDHHFFFQRIAIRNVTFVYNEVKFDVFVKLKDDTNDLNEFKGELEVLVIADVDNS